MDIHEVLDQKIKKLPLGPHIDGLRAVKSHIDVAVRHFLRGQSEPDETLFTDVIFRCNQAFEGSIKEAYRVIAGNDPQHVRPYDIEQFLSSSNLLRRKVLDQFTTYRREWRNPATHDYTLDFDEDEALVAIVSVTVFAIVLCDQIDNKLAFEAAASISASGALSREELDAPLLDLVAEKVLKFAQGHVDNVGATNSPAHDYYRLEGALAGFLSSELAALSGVNVEQNTKFSSREADIVVGRSAEKVVIELKRTSSRSSPKAITQQAVTQVSLYLHEPDIVGAVVFIYNIARGDYDVVQASGALAGRVKIVAAKS